MSGQTYTSPSAEETEMNRIHYDLEYTEGINQRMRIPETLKVAPDAHSGGLPVHHLFPFPTTLMQVPERIIIAGDEDDPRFSRPHDLDLIQTTGPPMDLLDMKAPPRTLTLSEQPLDSLETEQTPSPQSHVSQGVRSHSRSRRERSVSENLAPRHVSHTGRADMSVSPSPSAAPPPFRACPPLCSPEDANYSLYTAGGVLCYIQSTTRRAYQQVLELLEDGPRRTQMEMTLDLAAEESSLVDASSLRRQIVKLNRRLQLLEEENKERSRREMILYSATVAFWLVNTWTWFRR
ncbi:mitochondrial fission factor homolog A-like [Gadus chalcogrammus]|uniref:mitochondrial fission factor homolog A-like n=1 Tax=Gadus chalcogrammus TaxID=1042646 RepID=UPI0024C494A6|nr:mitochondrial fission factor homolog A-like [Gadus chalcogrammus]